MTAHTTSGKCLVLGDPVPWFSSALVTGGSFDLHASAGRWVVLCFLGSPDHDRAIAELAELRNEPQLFSEDHIIAGYVFNRPPEDIARYAAITSPSSFFVADYDDTISRLYGAFEAPRTVVLDPMLRLVADIAWDAPQGHAQTLRNLLRSLPSVDGSAGVPMFPPALIVPRVFGFDLCDFLVQFYEDQGGVDSGFQFDVAGKTTTVTDWRLKRRSDVLVTAPEVRELMRISIVHRLLPAIERYFQFRATRMDRFLIGCYDGAVGGHFRRHRDDINAGAQHRRFAVSINLNKGYEGGDLIFPEFGHTTYRGPEGGAIVFSCSALHEVRPVTSGKRYAFVAFLYGEEDAKRREANNSRLHAGLTPYTGTQDRLYPEDDASPRMLEDA